MASEVDVDDVYDAPIAVHKYDVAPNHVIPVANGRRRELSHEVRRNRVKAVAPVVIECKANYKAGIPIAGQAVFRAETNYRVIVMMVPPIVDNLVLVVIEPRVVFVPMMLVMLVFLGSSDVAAERGEREGRKSCHQPT